MHTKPRAPATPPDTFAPRRRVVVDDVFPGWPRAVTRAVDALALLVAVGVAACVVGDLDVTGRPVLALVFFLAVPGWASVRTFGARGSNLTAFGAIGVSVALTLLGGELLVTRLDWAWQPAATGMAILSALALAVRVLRP